MAFCQPPRNSTYDVRRGVVSLSFPSLGKILPLGTAMNISKEALCSLSLYLRIYAVHVTFGRIIYLFPNIIYLFLHYIYIELLLNREIIKFLTS